MMTMTMATVRWATTQQAMTMMIGTSKDDDNDDGNGNGAMGNEVDDDGDGVTGNGATGYDDNGGNGSALPATKLTIMA